MSYKKLGEKKTLIFFYFFNKKENTTKQINIGMINSWVQQSESNCGKEQTNIIGNHVCQEIVAQGWGCAKPFQCNHQQQQKLKILFFFLIKVHFFFLGFLYFFISFQILLFYDFGLFLFSTSCSMVVYKEVSWIRKLWFTMAFHLLLQFSPLTPFSDF